MWDSDNSGLKSLLKSCDFLATNRKRPLRNGLIHKKAKLGPKLILSSLEHPTGVTAFILVIQIHK